MLTQSAWAATRKSKSYFTTRYTTIAARRGSKRAVVALARFLLIIAYHMLTRNVPFHELGPNYLTDRQRNREIRYHIKRLNALGVALPSGQDTDTET
jgi:hypothetical protein